MDYLEELKKVGERNVASRQIDKKVTRQVRIDSGLHKLVKIEAISAGSTIRELVEWALAEYLSKNNEGKKI